MMLMAALRAVTFDLWETLLFERNGANALRTETRCRNFANALRRFDVEVLPSQVARALEDMISFLLKTWNKNKDISHQEQLKLVVKYATEGAVTMEENWIKELSAAYVSPIYEVPPYLNPSALTVLKWLKNQNKRVGLICNTGLTPGFELRKFLAKENVAQYFDHMTFSDEISIRKPDPKIFLHTAQKLKTKPNEIVHIGDNLKSDVWGAKNAGFKAFHLQTNEGHDKIAQSDPNSLLSVSRNLGETGKKELTADKTITSLSMTTNAIKQLENRSRLTTTGSTHSWEARSRSETEAKRPQSL
jgi:putative hydrolase of the HAD superfamily